MPEADLSVSGVGETSVISLAGKITQCASARSETEGSLVPNGNGSSQQQVNEFTNGLKFTALRINIRGVSAPAAALRAAAGCHARNKVSN